MKLGAEFYQQDAVSLAKNLIGKNLVRIIGSNKIVCKIVETEAYVGPEDKGCHAYNNKRTTRTEVMFKDGGIAYVYVIYGMHYCFNIVASLKDKPEAVFIRAVEPIEGLDTIKKNRHIKSPKNEELSNGPGKLAQALKIDKEFNGYNLVDGEELYVEADNSNTIYKVETSTRVNIDYAEEYKTKPWRFYIKGNSYVSRVKTT